MGAAVREQARRHPWLARCGCLHRADARRSAHCRAWRAELSALMPQVFVAAGSNIEPERHLAQAARELRRLFPDVRFSSWYRNQAVGFEGDDFINLVAGFTTELPVEEVVARLRAVEELCGRPRAAPKWAPRSMDLDILLYGDLTRDTPAL